MFHRARPAIPNDQFAQDSAVQIDFLQAIASLQQLPTKQSKLCL
jgi:hypothetical protein